MKYERIDHPKWKYRLTEDWNVGQFPIMERLVERHGREYTFSTLVSDGEGNGVCRNWILANKKGELIIKAGYASDGCSCSPDFEKA